MFEIEIEKVFSSSESYISIYIWIYGLDSLAVSNATDNLSLQNWRIGLYENVRFCIETTLNLGRKKFQFIRTNRVWITFIMFTQIFFFYTSSTSPLPLNMNAGFTLKGKDDDLDDRVISNNKQKAYWMLLSIYFFPCHFIPSIWISISYYLTILRHIC